ncbi:Gfo/Idh/MocA family oxidoreductase [Humibacillus xanthopallidus]|uniref:Gfo/Idh/MocA family oxidoreductase n=1 Tax=Humibacillus xanthopallidus TaxID=412689 RepID=UPI00385151B9
MCEAVASGVVHRSIHASWPDRARPNRLVPRRHLVPASRSRVLGGDGRDPAVTGAVAERVGAQVADSPESLIGSGVDAVVIAAAADAHTRLIRAGIDAGVPVFCEKPLSGDLSEAAEIAHYVNGSGIEVQVGYPPRIGPTYAVRSPCVNASRPRRRPATGASACCRTTSPRP